MFLLIAYGLLPAMTAFVLAFFGDSLTIYLTGLLLSLPGLVLAAPTAGAIDRLQERLYRDGNDIDLLGALTETRVSG